MGKIDAIIEMLNNAKASNDKRVYVQAISMAIESLEEIQNEQVNDSKMCQG